MDDFEKLCDLLKAHREVAVIAALNIVAGDKAIVAGAYEGTTIKFLCDFFPEIEVHGYEPQDPMRDRAARVLRGYSNVHLHEYGIGVEAGSFPMVRAGTDMCSFVPDETPITNVGELRLIDDVIADLGHVHLMVLNMEKYEHVLLPYMVKHDLMQHVDHLLVQFHGDEDDHAPSADLLDGLHRTHTLKWARPRWQWAHWELGR